MLRGIIVKYFSEKGFGFIYGDDNIRRFFHISDVNKKYRPKINDIVLFSPSTSVKGNKAVGIIQFNKSLNKDNNKKNVLVLEIEGILNKLSNANTEEKILLYEKIIKISPSHLIHLHQRIYELCLRVEKVDFIKNIGNALFSEKQYRYAIQYFEILHILNSANFEIYYKLGYSYEKLPDAEKADYYLKLSTSMSDFDFNKCKKILTLNDCNIGNSFYYFNTCIYCNMYKDAVLVYKNIENNRLKFDKANIDYDFMIREYKYLIDELKIASSRHEEFRNISYLLGTKKEELERKYSEYIQNKIQNKIKNAKEDHTPKLKEQSIAETVEEIMSRAWDPSACE